MIIKEILEELKTAKNPVVKAIHKGENFKVIVLALKQGMELKEHKTMLPAKIFVLSGSVIYHEGDKSLSLNQYDQTDIPEGVIHAVTCSTEALCLLTQG